jgi:hypothetical protein
MKRIGGRAIYVGTIVAILAMIGGFVAATVSITNSSQNSQANFVSASGAVTGLTYTSTVLTSVVGSPPASSGTPGAPQTLAAGANTWCVSAACTNGDVSENITYTFTVALAGSIMIHVNVVATSNTVRTVYLAQAGTAVAGTIVLVVDLGTTTSTITSITVTAQQCSGATCP